MEIKAEQRDDVAVVSVSGSIDATTADQLTGAFEEQISAGRVNLVVDFGGVDYTSSAGLRALLGAMKSSRGAGGDLRLAEIHDDVHRVLEMSGFTSILKTYEGVDEAVASFKL